MADTTNSNSWVEALKRGEMPTLPVALSLDSTTIISVTAIVVILTTIFIIFKYKK